MKYFVVVKSNRSDFENAINELLEAGWILQGGVSITREQGNLTWAQAMLKM